MKKALLILALSTSTLYGCDNEKEEIPLALEGEYQSGNTLLAANPVMMYTKNGPVTNQQVIDQFLLHRPWTKDYFSKIDVPTPDYAFCHLTIQSNKSVDILFGSSPNAGMSKGKITSQTSEYAIITQLDSAFVRYSPSNWCEQKENEIKNINPDKSCVNTSSTTGSSQVCKFQPVKLLSIKEGKLFIPHFNWLAQKRPPAYNEAYNGCISMASAGEWNTFNPAVISKLEVGDTVVVQLREIELIKQR